MTAPRKNIMLGTAGHVDHGKTALVKLLTGCETDTLAEEKQRGLTIDLGFAPCRLADERIVGVVDVPGHVDFIRNMVAGAHGVDVVIFVVAADDGIMPQTHEHLHILTLMGLRHGLVALTKIDLVEPERRQRGDRGLAPAAGGNLPGQRARLPALQYHRRGLRGLLRRAQPGGGRLRGPVQRRPVPPLGRGRVHHSRPGHRHHRHSHAAAECAIGDTLTLLPAGLAGHVRRMQVYGEDATEARAGECVALNLPEIDHRGRAPRHGALRLRCARAGDNGRRRVANPGLGEGQGRGLPRSPSAHRHRVGAGAGRHAGDNRDGAGQKQMVQLRLAEPLPLAPGDRFVVRANLPAQDQSGLATIGGGRILGVSNVRLRRKKAWTLSLTGRAPRGPG